MWPGRGDAGLCSFGCTYKSLSAELQHSDRELVCEVAHSGESSASSLTVIRPASAFDPGPGTSCWGRGGAGGAGAEWGGQARGFKKGPRAGVL